MWSRAWLQRRRTRSCYNTLLQELRAEDIDEYKNTPIPIKNFDHVNKGSSLSKFSIKNFDKVFDGKL
jgi:hypothetical protein